MALTLKTTMYSVIIFSLVVVSALIFTNSFISNYGVTLPGNTSQELSLVSDILIDTNKTVNDDMYELTNEMEEETESDEGIAAIGSTTSIAQSMYSVITLPLKAVKGIKTLITVFSNLIQGVPPFVTMTISSLIIIAIIIAIWSTLFGKNPGKT